jgi:predicted ferric reductase
MSSLDPAPLRARSPLPRRPRPGAVPTPPAARVFWLDMAGSAAIFSVVAVIALWLANGGLEDLGSLPSGLSSAGRMTGLVSADLLLIQVLLMARVPWIERAYGQDLLARRHRVVGFTSFNLMLAHVVLITVGYAMQGHVGVLGQAWELVVSYPGMLLATASLGLFMLVVGTSIRAARRRLRYESWHLIHLYAYVGVGLALPHEIWTGADFTSSAATRAYWWGLYGLAAGSVLLFRLALPAWRTVRHALVVEQVVTEGPGVVSVYLRGRHLDRMPVRAGQFLTWRFLTGRGWSRGNPYSVSAAPDGRRLRITAKVLGDGSASLVKLRRGTRAIVEGPYGALTGDVRTRRRVTLLASGIGVTPLRALLEDLDYAPGEAILIYRASTSGDFLFRQELDRIAEARGARVVYLPGRRAARPSWLPEQYAHLRDHVALLRLVPEIAHSDVFICGSDGWIDAVHAAAKRAGVPANQIHQERFAW